MGERLRQEPHGKSAEIVRQQVESVTVVDVQADVVVEGYALNPVHKQHGELRFVRVLRVNKQFLVYIPHLCEVSRLYAFKFVGNQFVAFVTPRLLLRKAFQCVKVAVALAAHLEHNGEVAA